jgi:hypothetical protein
MDSNMNSIKKCELIKANILAMCPPNNRPIIIIQATENTENTNNSKNANECIMEISQMCERSYKCIKYLYISSDKPTITDKIVQIWCEEFVNEVGYEPFITELHEERTENEIYKDIYTMFVCG